MIGRSRLNGIDKRLDALAPAEMGCPNCKRQLVEVEIDEGEEPNVPPGPPCLNPDNCPRNGRVAQIVVVRLKPRFE